MATKADYPEALKAWCPECNANPAWPCKTFTGLVKLFPHAMRLKRAASLVRGALLSPLVPGEEEAWPRDERDRSLQAEQLPLIGYEE